jgi:hypothetical protein
MLSSQYAFEFMPISERNRQASAAVQPMDVPYRRYTCSSQ